MSQNEGSCVVPDTLDWMEAADWSDDDDENQTALSWMTSHDWLMSDAKSETGLDQSNQEEENNRSPSVLHPCEKEIGGIAYNSLVTEATNTEKSNDVMMQPFVVMCRDATIDEMAKSTPVLKANDYVQDKPAHRNARAFIQKVIEFLGQKDLRALLKYEEVIDYCGKEYQGHALRNAFIYLCAAVKKCSAPKKVIDTALERYREERRKYDEFRYGQQMGFSSFESTFYTDNYKASLKICNKEIAILEKLFDAAKKVVNINSAKYMHHWASCTSNLAVLIASENTCWNTNRLEYNSLEFMTKTSRGFAINHGEKKYTFSKDCGSVLVRYAVLRKWIDVKTDKVLVNIRGTQYRARPLQKKDLSSSRAICNVCNKQISSKSHLKIHMRVHSKERPFECPVCSAKFADSSNFKKHKNLHPSETDDEEDGL